MFFNFGIILIALILFILFSAVKILPEYERGVVFTLGRYTGVKGPGLILLLEKIHQSERLRLLKSVFLELYLGGFVDLFAFELEKSRVLSVPEHAGDEDGGKCLLVSIVRSDGVIEGLPRKGDLVFGCGQFLLQVGHILVGLQVGIAFR